jgi:hypothetical protein
VQQDRRIFITAWAYRIYLNGEHMGTGLTAASVREAPQANASHPAENAGAQLRPPSIGAYERSALSKN